MEFIDIVDDQNQVIGKTTQKEIYEKKHNHRIVHILVINPKTKEIYFQKYKNSVETEFFTYVPELRLR